MSIRKNFIYNVTYQILILALPLITAPYISRVIGVEGVGLYSYTHSIAVFFTLFAMLGLNNYGNRSIARVRDDKNKLSATFWNIYSLQFLSSILIIISYIIFIINSSPEYTTLLVVQLAFVVSYLFDINWFYFGIEQFKFTVIRNAIIKIITTVLIFIFVKTEEDLTLYAIILSVGTFFSQIVLWSFIKRHIIFVKPNFREVLSHIKPNLILFLPVIAVNMYRVMDKIMLSALSGVTQTGLYTSADTIVTIPLSIITALGTVMLPRMSNMVVIGKKVKAREYIRVSMQFALFLSIAMMFGLMTIGEKFAPIYFGSDFAESGKLIVWLAPIILFAAWGNVIRTQYLIPNGLDKGYVLSVIIGAVISLCLNLLLIPKYGAMGAVFGSLAAELSVITYQTYIVRKKLDIITYIKDSYVFMFSGLIMFVILLMSNLVISDSIYGLIIQIIIGILIYFFISIFLYRYTDKQRFNYLIERIDIKGISNRVQKK